jgi:hypothetical protein
VKHLGQLHEGDHLGQLLTADKISVLKLNSSSEPMPCYLPVQIASDVGQALRTLRNSVHHSVTPACSSLRLAPCYPLLHTPDLSEKELSSSTGTFIRTNLFGQVIFLGNFTAAKTS